MISCEDKQLDEQKREVKEKKKNHADNRMSANTDANLEWVTTPAYEFIRPPVAHAPLYLALNETQGKLAEREIELDQPRSEGGH